MGGGVAAAGVNNENAGCTNRTLDNQLRTRRKVAKMLIAVVIMFSINFFPVHLLPIINVTNDFIIEKVQSEVHRTLNSFFSSSWTGR